VPYRITAAAKADLLEIGRFTQLRWGVAKRRLYVATMETAFAQIADHPNIGAACPEIRAGYKQKVVGRHIVYYRLGRDGTVEIIRVLHQSMAIEPF
jgi:toxin ParE1/3/4